MISYNVMLRLKNELINIKLSIKVMVMAIFDGFLGSFPNLFSFCCPGHKAIKKYEKTEIIYKTV